MDGSYRNSHSVQPDDLLQALEQIASTRKSVPNSDSTDSAELTNIDKRDAIRLIKNVVAGLKMAQQYTDRMTTDQIQNLAAAISEAEAALVDIQFTSAGGAGALATTRTNPTTETTIANQYAAVKTAASRAKDALDLALKGAGSDGTTTTGVSYVANSGLGDAATSASIYAALFGDHADGGDIRIDENADTSAVDAARIIGNISVTGNATSGNARINTAVGWGWKRKRRSAIAIS